MCLLLKFRLDLRMTYRDMLKSTFITVSFRIKSSISRDDVNYAACEDLHSSSPANRNRRISMGQIEI